MIHSTKCSATCSVGSPNIRQRERDKTVDLIIARRNEHWEKAAEREGKKWFDVCGPSSSRGVCLLTCIYSGIGVSFRSFVT